MEMTAATDCCQPPLPVLTPPYPQASAGTMMLSGSVDVPSPGGMSAAAARNVVRSSSISGAMYSLEKSPSSGVGGGGGGGGGGGVGDAGVLAGNKKRRSSLGAKMVAIVGLSQWSKSTLQLNQQDGGTKKLRSTIRRSTETGIAVEMRNRVTGRAARSPLTAAPTATALTERSSFPPLAWAQSLSSATSWTALALPRLWDGKR
ncbi:hypothetical protein AALO_G00260740 [Alosa alosa]|uniref:Regulating synaptic membrane exocytosis protein 3 n=1 Tax=Alosa alosa TaxID=278164 RepID=A0AAV6FTE7_9TELE|nr:hypothetical protein AALO_G00260740 [Alosa alosa]